MEPRRPPSPPDGESVYNPNTNPTVLNEFASAAMRFGHSMINSLFKGKRQD
jgi:hypothetical protein